MAERLVSFVDFAPTVLSLAGVEPPERMQGSAFLGEYIGAAPKYLHGMRGRMDERHDLVRSITDGRYVYLRNYLPYLSSGQHVAYQMQTPSTAQWRALFDAGQLNASQSAFWQSRAPEELYDLQSDPDEANNLADSPSHQEIKARLHSALLEHAREIVDVAFLPEGELLSRMPGVSPYDFARLPTVYPFERILAMAERASTPGESALSELRAGLGDSDSAVRYWAALGLRMLETAGLSDLGGALDDESPFVSIVAADGLATFADAEDRERGLARLLHYADPAQQDSFVSAAALAALDGLAEIPPAAQTTIATFSAASAQWPDGNYCNVIEGLLNHLQSRFGT